MRACTFFGHRDCPETIRPKLRTTLKELIEGHGVDMFYVGNQGRFDALVRTELRILQDTYPHIRYAVVLAYMPRRKDEYEHYSDTMLPEGIESVHPRYAISWRNNWMLKHADYVVTFITHNWGSAAKYAHRAQNAAKIIYNLNLRTEAALEDIASS